MAVTLPGVDVELLPGKSRVPLVPRIINAHTMVGTLAGTEAHFRPAGRPYSHLGLRGDGYGRQWQPFDYRAASDLDGNPYSISIECEDRGPLFPAWSGSDVPPFTPAQVEWLVVTLAWLCRRYTIPPVLTPDSKLGRMGPSYHRLGIDPWRVAGGLRYSSSYGKVCPGDRRISQFVTVIVPRVAMLVNGQTPGPTPTPEDDDMPATYRIDLGDRVAFVLPDGTVCDVSFDNVPGSDPVKAKPILEGSEADQAMTAVYITRRASAVHVDRAQACVSRSTRARFGT